MKCVIPGANLKVFGRAIHSLSKVGDEIYLEALHNGLALRTVNSSRSAYACFVFVPTFFTMYDGSCGAQKDSDDLDLLKCKIAMKSCLSVFKSLSVLEKTVEKCTLSMDENEDRLVFQLYCKHGIVKTYNLTFIECESLQAVFSKDFSPNVLSAQSKLFYDAVGNFQTGQEEITLFINPERVILKNYVDDEPDPHKVIRTELSLLPEEFENYRVGIDTDVTFCLKELRALLSFAEPCNLPLAVHFESSGRLIILTVDSDPSFEANFVLATLADHSTQVSSSQQLAKVQAPLTRKGTSLSSKKPVKTTSSWSVDRGKSSHSLNTSSVDTRARKQTEHLNTLKKMPTDMNSMLNLTSSRRQGVSTATRRLDKTSSEADDIDICNVTTRNMTACNAEGDRLRKGCEDILGTATAVRLSDRVEKLSGVLQNSSQNPRVVTGATDNIPTTMNYPDANPVIPVEETAVDKLISSNYLYEQKELLVGTSEDEDDDLVPGTPPNKKFRSLFFGVSQSTTGGCSQQTQQLPVILAEDSDED